MDLAMQYLHCTQLNTNLIMYNRYRVILLQKKKNYNLVIEIRLLTALSERKFYNVIFVKPAFRIFIISRHRFNRNLKIYQRISILFFVFCVFWSAIRPSVECFDVGEPAETPSQVQIRIPTVHLQLICQVCFGAVNSLLILFIVVSKWLRIAK